MRPRLALIAQNPAIPYVFTAAAAEQVDVVNVHLPAGRPPAGLPAMVENLAGDVFADREETLSLLRDRHRAAPFDGVLTLYEAAVPFTAEVAALLGLPGLPVAVARACRDKSVQRESFRRHGLACPGFRRVDTPEDAVRAAAGLRLPVVVKPTSGLSSQGVVRADTLQDVARAAHVVAAINAETLARYADAGRGDRPGILVEEYVDGPELCAESFTHEGRTAVLALADKGYPTGPTFEEGVYITPPALPDEVTRRVRSEVVAAHQALGITTGASHTELRLRDGTDPVLLEVGARMGGSGVVHSPVVQATGIDFARLVVREALGLPPDPEPPAVPRPRATSANWIVPLGGHGEFAGLRGLDEVRRHPDTVDVLPLLAPGTQVPPWPRFAGYPGFVLSRHDSYQRCRDYQDWLAETLRADWRPASPTVAAVAR